MSKNRKPMIRTNEQAQRDATRKQVNAAKAAKRAAKMAKRRSGTVGPDGHDQASFDGR